MGQRIVEVDRLLEDAYSVENDTIQNIKSQHESKGSISVKQYHYVLSLAKKFCKKDVTIDFTMTDEQQEIVGAAKEIIANAAKTYLGVRAFAGAGKTSTLKALSVVLKDYRVLYIVFNRATREEAEQKLPSNVEVRTWHSLAFSGFGRQFKGRFVNSILPIVQDIEKNVDIREISELSEGDDRNAAFVAIQTINAFCKSADSEITPDHVPSAFTSKIKGDKAQKNAAAAAVKCATRVWSEITKKGSKIPATHDFYLKLYQLSNPTLDYDFLMVDEAQDTNAVCFGIIDSAETSNVILVGDTHQQIYSFRGAVNALDKVNGISKYLTKSFRFGSNIAAQANRVLSLLGEDKELVGASSNAGVVTDDPDSRNEDAVLCRSNAGVIREAIAGLDSGKQIAVVGGTDEAVRMLNAAYDLFCGRRTDHIDLAIFNEWSEIKEYADTTDGKALVPIVNIVERENSNIPNLCRRLKWETVSEDQADVVISTAHKAKGREWDSVYLGHDFPHIVTEIVNEDDEVVGATLNREEANLLYVSITRAMKEINLGVNEQMITFCEKLNKEFGV